MNTKVVLNSRKIYTVRSMVEKSIDSYSVHWTPVDIGCKYIPDFSHTK